VWASLQSNLLRGPPWARAKLERDHASSPTSTDRRIARFALDKTIDTVLVTGLQVTVGTGSPTTGLYRFSVGAFWAVDIYFLVVAKTCLVVYSVGVLLEVVLMGLGSPHWVFASCTVSPHLVGSWRALLGFMCTGAIGRRILLVVDCKSTQATVWVAGGW
jgi:hypothetical protein